MSSSSFGPAKATLCGGAIWCGRGPSGNRPSCALLRRWRSFQPVDLKIADPFDHLVEHSVPAFDGALALLAPASCKPAVAEFLDDVRRHYDLASGREDRGVAVGLPAMRE